jgi:CRP/FNR family transcriptional regulator
MSLSACFFNNESPSQAIAAEQTLALTIPARFVTKWQKEYNSWNNFVIKTFRNRYDELLGTFESVAFDHVDKRILEYLRGKASKQKAREVEISHQALANELGTTRVVVSRILKQFEMDKLIELHRGFIKVR